MRILAYIDLPSGSAVFQFLIAGLLGLSVAFRSFWAWVWQTVRGRRRDPHGAEGPETPHRTGASSQAGGHTAQEASARSGTEPDAQARQG